MVQRLTNLFLVSALLSACSLPHSWAISSIATGDRSFDCSRLRYLPLEENHPLTFEMVKNGEHLTAFIHLNRFRFTQKSQIKVSLNIEKEIFEEEVLVHEGAMRLRLSAEMAKKVIQALQKGLEVGILVDGFEETLKPNQFSSFFSQFLGGEYILKD